MSPPSEAAPAMAAMAEGRNARGYESLDAETAELSYAEFSKRDRPFVMPLDPTDPDWSTSRL